MIREILGRLRKHIPGGLPIVERGGKGKRSLQGRLIRRSQVNARCKVESDIGTPIWLFGSQDFTSDQR